MHIRDDNWLRLKFEALRKRCFADVELLNPIEVRFGREVVSRFGSIRLTRDKVSLILINGYFRSPLVPEKVVLATLAHEMAHYVHGFSSLRPQLYRHPHRSGVVTRELTKRSLAEWEEFEGRWSKANWHNFVGVQRKLVRAVRTRKPGLLKLGRALVAKSNAFQDWPRLIEVFRRTYWRPRG